MSKDSGCESLLKISEMDMAKCYILKKISLTLHYQDEFDRQDWKQFK